MLLAFLEQLGHDHEALMENTRVESEDDNIPESDPSALLLYWLAQRFVKAHRKYKDDEDEEGEESSDD